MCSLRPDPGPCRGEVQRWYYLPRCAACTLRIYTCHAPSTTTAESSFPPPLWLLGYPLSRTASCISFPWGGCGGNSNNFPSSSACRLACANPLPLPAARRGAAGEGGGEGCALEPQAGPCTQRITRWYYSGERCQRFQYGGCAGNRNNFASLGACHRCPGLASPHPPLQGVWRRGLR